MATLTDILITSFEVKGLDSLSRGIGDLGNLFITLAETEGLATAAAGTLSAALSLINPALLVIGAAIAVIGTGFAIAKKGLAEFGDSEAAVARLAVQMKNLGNVFPTKELLNFAGNLSHLTGIDDELIATLGATAAQFGLNRAEIEKLLPAVLDIATAKGLDPDSVLGVLLRAGRGRPQGLVKLGIDPAKITGDLKNINNLIAQVSKGFEGTAEAFRGTLPGTVNALQTAVGNLFEALGRFLSPVVVPLLNLLIAGIEKLTALLENIANLFPDVFPTAAKLGEGGKPSDVALKGDPEQTGYLKQIAGNTAAISPFVREVLGGSGAVAKGAFTFRDARMAFGI